MAGGRDLQGRPSQGVTALSRGLLGVTFIGMAGSIIALLASYLTS